MEGKVLLYGPIDASGMDIMRQAGLTVDIPENLDAGHLEGIAAGYDAILVRGMAPLPGSVLKKAARCRVVSRHGVGLETIDVVAATRLHIPVANTPGANANAVAEQAVGLMLDVLKHSCFLNERMKKAQDYQIRLRVTCHELAGRTLGLVGLGNIGRRVAHICGMGFGMKVVGYDPCIGQAELDAMGCAIEALPDMEAVLRRADVLSLHAPGGKKPLIGKRELAQMKEGSVLVNTARGTLIDEAALAGALKDGHLLGAGLDVMAAEPPPAEHPFYHMDNVVLLPHTAALTRESNRAMAVRSATALVQVLRGERPEALANPEVWDSRRR